MTQPATPTLEPDRIAQVPVGLLTPDADQPRTHFDEASLKALAAELKARGGPEQPLLVRSDWVIKDGERRWRAAKLAGLATLPCLLAKPAAEENATVEWRLDQACVNHHRDPLTALDWAHTLRELVERHGIAVGEIPALLAGRGITMSRSYVSNLIRINDLPEWAKGFIANGTLPPAAGKYILMAADYPPAMEALRKTVEQMVGRLEPGFALKGDLSWEVRRAFQESSTQLDVSWGDDAPAFNWRESCKGCPTRANLDHASFCLNRTCFDEKQAAGLARREKKETATRETVKRDPKQVAREAAEKRRHQALRTARARAAEKCIEAASGKLDRTDLLLLIDAIAGFSNVRRVAERRGWNIMKGDWIRAFAKKAEALNAAGLHGLLLDLAIDPELNPGRYQVAAYRRHRIDLKALEKSALAELKAAKAPAKAKA